jgi:hypothetical protein
LRRVGRYSGEGAHFVVGDATDVEPPTFNVVTFKEFTVTFSLVD